MTKAEAMRAFFSTPEKPVTNSELMAFRKGDPKGYNELGEAALAALDKKA